MINNKNKIIILRHGESEGNLNEGIIQGFSAPLNEKGIIQATEAANRLSGYSIQQIITSNIERAIMTGQVIGKILKIDDIVINDVFNERNPGIIKGLTHDEVKKIHPNLWNFEDNTLNLLERPPEGENIDDLDIRVDNAIRYINLIDKPTLIVSHGGFIRCLLKKLRNLKTQGDISLIQIPNCSFFELN